MSRAPEMRDDKEGGEGEGGGQGKGAEIPSAHKQSIHFSQPSSASSQTKPDPRPPDPPTCPPPRFQ